MEGSIVRQRLTLDGHAAWVSSVAFSPDGTCKWGSHDQTMGNGDRAGGGRHRRPQGGCALSCLQSGRDNGGHRQW